jgi:hypothetical protein
MALSQSTTDVHKVAVRLVRAGLLASATLDDGTVIWLGRHGQLRQGAPLFAQDDAGRVAVKLPLRPDGRFAVASTVASMHFQHAEHKLFTTHAGFPSARVRGLMPACRLLARDQAYIVYPTLVWYATGVLTISLRLIGAGPMLLDPFVREILGMRARRFLATLVPPAVLRAAGGAALGWHREDGIVGRGFAARRRALAVLHEIEEAARKESLPPDPAEPFAGPLVPLQILDTGDDRLIDLGAALGQAAAYAASGPRDGRSLLARGQVALTEPLDPFYARSHVYLTRHSDQRASARENEATHAEAFWRMLTGIAETPHGPEDWRLPANTRAMGDMGWYVTPLTTLTVWSADGLAAMEREPDMIPPSVERNIYEQHVRAEALEYGHALYRRFGALALRPAEGPSATADVLRAQRETLALDTALDEATPLAEVRAYLRDGWHALDVAGLRARTREALAVRRDEAALEATRAQNRWSTVMTLVFGFLAVPTLAKDVVAPLGVRFRWWPTVPEGEVGLAPLAAAGLLVIAVLLASGLLPRRRDGGRTRG